MAYTYYSVLYGGFENDKKKDKNIWPSGAGIWTPHFWTIFPPLIWILTEGEGEEIKSRQPPKKDRTLWRTWYSHMAILIRPTPLKSFADHISTNILLLVMLENKSVWPLRVDKNVSCQITKGSSRKNHIKVCKNFQHE